MRISSVIKRVKVWVEEGSRLCEAEQNIQHEHASAAAAEEDKISMPMRAMITTKVVAMMTRSKAKMMAPVWPKWGEQERPCTSCDGRQKKIRKRLNIAYLSSLHFEIFSCCSHNLFTYPDRFQFDGMVNMKAPAVSRVSKSVFVRVGPMDLTAHCHRSSVLRWGGRSGARTQELLQTTHHSLQSTSWLG